MAGGLVGALLTGGGKRRGRGGSEVESWTGAPLGILRRVDWRRRLCFSCSGHGDVSGNDRKWARLAQAKEADERMLWLGSSWYLFEVQMTD